MPQGDAAVLMVVGGVFLALGLAAFTWGRREERGYFNSLSARPGDLREFVSHWPPRPQPGALKLGGGLAAVIGVLLLAVGSITWLWGGGA